MKLFNKPLRLKPRKKNIPDGLWSKCPKCQTAIFNKILEENYKVCPKCDNHFSLTCWERLGQIVDKDTFTEHKAQLQSQDPLSFNGPKSYKQKLVMDKKSTGLSEAAIVGDAALQGRRIALGITDSRFIMGSMGSVVGEKITYAAELALSERMPLVIVSGSGGGARMYEGVLSLMQMAKTSAAICRLKQAGVAYISILTHPTMAGVLASFAGIGDVIVAEPGALIGFTGPRVIKQTIKQDLPEGFQTSEFNLEHGLIDIVVHRRELKSTVAKLLDYLG